MTIQYIASDNNQKGRKQVLWRKGDYRYQIEITKNGVSSTREFEAEYYEALETFNQIMQDLDLVEA